MISKDISKDASQISKDVIVVIGRNFGSGGRSVGKKLADRLGLKYYDREILSEAAERYGFDKSIFLNADEKKPSILRSILASSVGVSDVCSSGGLTREEIYRAQSDVIRELGSQGGCLFVGRSADYILRDNPGLMSVFLHAPIEHRVANIIRRKEADSEAHARELARSKDRDREGFYNYFTGRKWGATSNYHLTIDTSYIDEDDIVDLLEIYIKSRFKTGS